MLTEEWRLKLRSAAETMYSDRCDVWRSSENVRSNGTTNVDFQPIEQDISCRISRVASRKDDVRQKLPPLTLEMEARLYCAPEADICAGDIIVVRRSAEAGWERRYTAGESFVYPSHRETPLWRQDEA